MYTKQTVRDVTVAFTELANEIYNNESLLHGPIGICQAIDNVCRSRMTEGLLVLCRYRMTEDLLDLTEKILSMVPPGSGYINFPKETRNKIFGKGEMVSGEKWEEYQHCKIAFRLGILHQLEKDASC